MVYQWANGSRYGVKADVAGAELERIGREAGGHITAGVVVDESRPDAAPLHPVFTWDDEKAAELYRQEEARSLIRSIRIIPDGAQKSEPMIAYVKVELDEVGPAYVTSARLVSDDDLRDQAIGDAVKFLRGAQKRFEHLSELGPVFRAIDKALTPIERKIEKQKLQAV